MKNLEFKYQIRKSTKAKNIRISIKPDGLVELVLPKFMPEFLGKTFLKKNKTWVLKNLEKQKIKKIHQEKNNFQKIKLEYSEKYYRDKAKKYLPERVIFFTNLLDIAFNQVRIKNTKTRWGSCSGKKNLNFSWKIMLAPEKVIDYLVVHEICHLKEMNHSQKFWSLVELLDPKFKEHKLWLQDHNYLLKI